MRVFLLGASGYIGSEVLKLLIKEQHNILALEHQTPLAKNKYSPAIKFSHSICTLSKIVEHRPIEKAPLTFIETFLPITQSLPNDI